MCVCIHIQLTLSPSEHLEWSINPTRAATNGQNILKTYLSCAYLRISDCSSPICRTWLNQRAWWWHGPELVCRPGGSQSSIIQGRSQSLIMKDRD